MPDTVAAPIVPQATGVPAADQPLLDAQLPGMTPAAGPVAAGPPVPANMILPPADAAATMAPPPGVPGGGISPAAPVGPAPVTDPLALARANLDDMRGVSIDEQQAAKDEADATTKANDAKADMLRDQSVQMQADQAEQDEQQRASDQARAHLVDLAQKSDDEVRDYKFTDWKSTVPTANRIGLALGAMLAGLGGSADPLAQINKLTAQHFEKQKAELGTKEAMAGYRRQGITDFDRHVNDQRMALEFKERNFREAMAKEAEAQGLRSGNPIVLAKSKQAAAQMRGDADAKLSTAIGQYTKGEEEHARAAMLDRKGKGGGGAGGVKSAAESALADAAQAGKPYADLVKLALKIPGVKDARKAATEAQAGAEKDVQSVWTDPETGKKYRAPSTRTMDQFSKDVAANDAYVEAANQYADHVERFGRILNPYSEEGQRRNSLAADVQSKGRVASGLNSTDAGQKLEHVMQGGTGVGLDTSPMANPKVLRELAARAAAKNKERLRGSLTPLDREGATPATKAVPPGAVVGKMNGKRGYVLDGKFTEL